jgi:hypothetical protein
MCFAKHHNNLIKTPTKLQEPNKKIVYIHS